MKSLLLILVASFSYLAIAVQVVNENPHASCQEFELYKELRVYKDPALFLPNLGMIYSDPQRGMEALMAENPLLTTVKGTFRLMPLGPKREFKNFGAIARLYESADPKFKTKNGKGEAKPKPLMMIPIKVCGNGDAYTDSLGFILESDLEASQVEEKDDSVFPPSTLANPIPKLRNP